MRSDAPQKTGQVHMVHHPADESVLETSMYPLLALVCFNRVLALFTHDQVSASCVTLSRSSLYAS